MKNKIIIISILLTLSGQLFAQDVLNKYLETAAKNNPALKAKFNEYNASLEKVPQVGTLPDPQLIFGYFIMPVETKNGPQQAKISFSQMFPWFGTLNSKENVFISAAKVKYQNFEDAKSNLFFEVKSTYYDLYFIKKGIDITLENIKILETFKRLSLIKIQAGRASGVDELRVELELNDLENNLALLKDNWFINSVKFNNFLNVDNHNDIQIPETLWIDDLQYSKQAVIDSLSLNNHQLKSLGFLKESFAFNEHLSKKQGLPKIILGVDYSAIGNAGTSPDAGKNAFMVKVGVTIPLYRKKYSAMVNEAVIQQQVIEDKKLDKVNVLETLFEKVYSKYTDANRRIILFEKQSILAKRAIKLLEKEYTNSGKNFEEILRMDKSVLKYSLELEKARADKQASIAFINYLMGY
ncbi:MAG: TolC family protein [Bacteroidetes bacterium]|nr:TolC family protein [Bacteroidota bacterium]